MCWALALVAFTSHSSTSLPHYQIKIVTTGPFICASCRAAASGLAACWCVSYCCADAGFLARPAGLKKRNGGGPGSALILPAPLPGPGISMRVNAHAMHNTRLLACFLIKLLDLPIAKNCWLKLPGHEYSTFRWKDTPQYTALQACHL